MVSFVVKGHISEKITSLFHENLQSKITYITTESEFSLIQHCCRDDVTHKNVELSIKFALNDKNLKKRNKEKNISIGIVNGFGNGIGSTLQGFNAIEILNDLLKKKYGFLDIEFNLYIRQTNSDRYFLHFLSLLSKKMSRRIRLSVLPVIDTEIFNNDFLIDNSGYLQDDTYLHLPIVDYFLKKLSLDFTMCGTEKNNSFFKEIVLTTVTNDFISTVEQQLDGKRTLLIHPLASNRLRSMPKDIVINLIHKVLELTNYYIVSAINMNVTSDRFIDISKHSNTVFKFAYILSKVDKTISVGTATYHIAAAFDKPVLVIPTVYSDITNVKYYHNTLLYKLPNIEHSAYFFRHKKSDLSDQEVAELWKNFDYHEVISWL